MVWNKVDGHPYHIKKSLRDLKGRASKVVQEGKHTLYVETPEIEQGWLTKVLKDFNLSYVSINFPPPFKEAPCGILTTFLSAHQTHCSKCRVAQGKVPINQRVTTVATVSGLRTLSVEGLISLFKVKMEEAMSLADNYEKAVKALEGLVGMEERLKKLEMEREEHKKVLSLFADKLN